MSFFTSPVEARLLAPHREDDLIPVASRSQAQRNARGPSGDMTDTFGEPLSHNGSGDLGARKNIVFPDPIAFRYLEDDPCVRVVERRATLRGYELYLVEQWACSRQSPTLVIVTYTGDEKHSVVVGVLSVPADENLWSIRLRVYFKATGQYLARPKDTELGELMVTNLSSFPSSLTVIPVPDGDIKAHRMNFIVNENLKRLGCSGRSALTLTPPAEATKAKFLSLYKVSDKINFTTAVIELVKLCQVALYMFAKLQHEYIDGLLCDVTEKAIGDWWTEVGAEHFNFEPNDGILGPATVAALLGMFMGARNRLYSYGAPVAKDVFDVENTKRGIYYFQKSVKLERTRRLDRPTLLKLHNVTAKAAAGEGWGVQKAMKSRMTEIGGKRGEIVMGIVSGKDKGGLADVETLDMDTFVTFAYGERAKWLWYGKPRRSPAESNNPEPGPSALAFGKHEESAQALYRPPTAQNNEEPEFKRREEFHHSFPEISPSSTANFMESPGEKEASRRNVLKSVAGKMSDAKSGFGRFKDVVGGSRRGHVSRPSITTKEEIVQAKNGQPVLSSASDISSIASPGIMPIGRAFTWKNKPEEYLAAMKRGEDAFTVPPPIMESRDPSTSTSDSKNAKRPADSDPELSNLVSDLRKEVLNADVSTGGSAVDEQDFQGSAAEAERKEFMHQLELARRNSFEVGQLYVKHEFNENRWPRRTSFGDAEEAILTWEEIIDIEGYTESLKDVKAVAEVVRNLSLSIDDITYNVEPWVEDKLRSVAVLDERLARDKEDIQALYQQLSEACYRVRYSSEQVIGDERSSLTQSVKDIEELLTRLEYEINSVSQKVDDVEEGVQNFQRQVEDVEKKAEELKAQLETETWLHWVVRKVTGIGMGANIIEDRR
ncbi:unnamed protein product [Clonostachys rhizophaga]|uniref:STB6-like N-terminal domain-containing protein n=1 Tax=Clonostachys rhizophaga TaxID=160324 RepID=A0A9N9YSF6_9HYPO|nr:unnamed protein product [Clonostachys rhizophaga]